MRVPSSFALQVPTVSRTAPVLRLKGTSDATRRRAKGLAMAALVAIVAVAGYAAGGDARGQSSTGDAAVSTGDLAAASSSVIETWAADESRNGTRPDAAH